MKLAVISDIHANLDALQATLADVSSQAADRILCLGDIVGYNTNPAECIALLRQADALSVAGNHDCAVCGRITIAAFSSIAARAVAWTRARMTRHDMAFLAALPLKAVIADALIAVHGALHPETGCESVRLDSNEKRLLSFKALMAHPSGARICAFGHTHDAAVYEFRNDRMTLRTEPVVHLKDDAYYLINPGTIGKRRTINRRASYMIVDLDRRTVTMRHIDYDGSLSFAATRNAGLAPRFTLPVSVRGAIGRSMRMPRLSGARRRLGAFILRLQRGRKPAVRSAASR